MFVIDVTDKSKGDHDATLPRVHRLIIIKYKVLIDLQLLIMSIIKQ